MISSEPKSAPRLRPEDIRLFPGRILVRRIPKAPRTAGGIELPDQTRTISQVGVVLGIGVLQEASIHVGDILVFSIYASSAAPMVATENLADDIVILREEDVFGVVTLNGQGDEDET